jgi:hypothetical protein
MNRCPGKRSAKSAWFAPCRSWDIARAREPRLTLGGWANPYADAAQQVEYMTDDRFNAEYYLTQIVSHLDIAPVERFVEQTRRSRISKPGMFGVFYYRSANPKTLLSPPSTTVAPATPTSGAGARRRAAAALLCFDHSHEGDARDF